MKISRNRIFAALVMMLLSLCPSQSVFAQDPALVISSWCGAPITRPDRSGYLDRILIEAFRRNNVQVKITEMPAERSLQQADAGETDGDFLRVTAIGDIYPNLVMVPESLYTMKFVAFSNRADVKIVNWKSLEPYRVGIVVGWKILEANVNNEQGRRSDIPNPDNMFRMLEAKRLDLALYSEEFGWDIIKRLGLKGINILKPPLAEKEMYLFLNKKHQKLIPKLAETLRAMKNDGTFSAIAKEALRDSGGQ